jgi:hypothetical protein
VRVYYLGNLDGRREAMVAAPTQKAACHLMCCSEYSYRQFGGHVTAREEFVRVAMSEPGRVFHREIYHGPPPQPSWHPARWQPIDPPPAPEPRKRRRP